MVRAIRPLARRCAARGRSNEIAAGKCTASHARPQERPAGDGARHRARRVVPAQMIRSRYMDRRNFLKLAAATPLVALPAGFASHVAWAAAPAGANYRNLVVLVELKGGNDGLNTVIPYTDATYYALRPKLAIPRAQVIALSETVGLHPALAPSLPFWKSKELAVLQGVGYPEPKLSHFRSIEIWDTASRSEQYLQDGWLTRAFTAAPVPRNFVADGVIIGSPDLGPLAGGGTRAIALTNTEQFLRQARLATPEGQSRNKPLQHILNIEPHLLQAASHLPPAKPLPLAS